MPLCAFAGMSGRYIQRRSAPPTAVSMVIRDLEPEMTYYVAIRAFNQRNEESMFSREVAVTVGNPETATVPFMGGGVAPGENVISGGGGTTLTGETGVGTTVAITIFFSALLGTVYAFRRQRLI